MAVAGERREEKIANKVNLRIPSTLRMGERDRLDRMPNTPKRALDDVMIEIAAMSATHNETQH